MSYQEPPQPELSDLNAPVDFREMLQGFLEKLWLIAAITLVVVIAGATYAFRATPIYQAKIVLEVDQEDKKFISIEEIAPQDLRSSEMVNTIAQSVKNSTILKRVIEKHRLAKDPFLWANQTVQPTESELIRAFNRIVDVKLRRQTRLIDVSVQHPDPKKAQELANALAHEFVAYKVEQRFGTAQVANRFLVEEAERLKVKLEQSEQALQAYKEKSRTVSLEDRQNIDLEKLKELNQRFTEAKSSRLQLAVDWNEIQKGAAQPELLVNIPSIANNPAVVAGKTKLAEAEASLVDLAVRYKAKHPAMLQAQAQVAETRDNLHRTVLDSIQTVRLAYAAAQATEKSFETALQQQELQALELNKKSIAFNVLKREVESDRGLYEAVLLRLKETDITKGIEKNNVRIVESASLPIEPVKPKRIRILAAALFLGFFGALGLVHLLNRLDSSIKTVDRAEQLLGLPVLGAIPRNKNIHDGTQRLVTLSEPEGACAEAFRSLRATIGLLGREGERKVTAFTSAVPGDGKTFSCVNYAVCLAQKGHRVLLIDLDLRKPSLAESFRLADDTPGVTNYLLGKDSLNDLVRATASENLFLLTAGTRVPNPAELLSEDWLRQLLKQASQEFDRIIIDTAPINAVSDTLPLMHLADTICLVARAHRTPSRAILRAIEILRRAEAAPAGVVLNFLRTRAGAGYYYYYAEKKPYGKGVYGSAYA